MIFIMKSYINHQSSTQTTNKQAWLSFKHEREMLQRPLTSCNFFLACFARSDKSAVLKQSSSLEHEAWTQMYGCPCFLVSSLCPRRASCSQHSTNIIMSVDVARHYLYINMPIFHILQISLCLLMLPGIIST